MMETEIPTIDLKLTTVKVEPEVRKTRVKLVNGTPVFGVHKSCRKSLGINNIFQYWIWKRRMRKKWNDEDLPWERENRTEEDIEQLKEIAKEVKAKE